MKQSTRAEWEKLSGASHKLEVTILSQGVIWADTDFGNISLRPEDGLV